MIVRRTAVGFALLLAAKAAPATFTEHVAPILATHCVVCHRAGAMAPMPLTDFEQVRPWAKSIRREVGARRMPPFNPSGEIGRYVDDPRLTQSEIDTLVEWIDGGTPRGPGDDAIDASTLPSTLGWRLGEPDLVLELPRVDVRAGSKDVYRILHSSHMFEHDIWIDALDWNVGTPAAVHHAIPKFISAFAPVPDGGISQLMGSSAPSLAKGLAAGYLPGSAPRQLPEGEAVLIPALTRLVVEMHYSSTDVDFSDETRVGLHLSNGWRKAAAPLLALQVLDLEIEPGDAAYTRTVTQPVVEDLLAYAFRFHMHVRGQSGRIDLLLPDGREEELISVPEYNFNWQHIYTLKEPRILPAGSHVRFTAVWNNSESNPRLVAPFREVRFGFRTDDEMGDGHVLVSPVDDARPSVYVVDGRESTPPGEGAAR